MEPIPEIFTESECLAFFGNVQGIVIGVTVIPGSKRPKLFHFYELLSPVFFIVKVKVFPRHLFREINRSSALLWQEFWYLYLNSLFQNKLQDILSSQKSLVLVLLNC